MQMRIPWVVALIVGGILFGPNGLDVFELNDTVDFLGTIGLVFLMFIAGLESKLYSIKKIKKKVAALALLSGTIPTLTGVGVALGFGYSLETALLLGIIFMSSAIGLLVPIFERKKIINSDLVRTVVAGAVIIDATSLLLLSVYLQVTISDGVTMQSLLVYPIALLVLGAFAWVLPKLEWIASKRLKKDGDLYENELQFTILIIIGLVIFFEIIGLHAIVAGFFAGIILSRSLENPLLKAKLHAISYGFFIPVFFVSVGAQSDVGVFINTPEALILMFSIIGALLVSKLVSGWTAGRLSGFNNRSSIFMGASVIPHLSTALAVAFLGFGEGLLDQVLMSSVIGMTIVTSIVSPLVVDRIGNSISSRNRKNEA